LLQISPNWFLGNWTLDRRLKWALVTFTILTIIKLFSVNVNLIFKISCPQSPEVLEILLLSSVPVWSFRLFQVGELFKSASNFGNSYSIDEKFQGIGIPMSEFLESII
jgi:hypothetical protein